MRTGVSSMTPDNIGGGSTGAISIGSPGRGSSLFEDGGSATEELDSRCPVSMLEPDSGSI